MSKITIDCEKDKVDIFMDILLRKVDVGFRNFRDDGNTELVTSVGTITVEK
ncbi:hypothetical protein LCGC14_2154090 [marine sediment metagenome]|uniref:Uncharacterized protein n=1 Tax=marine sediment metagenome TaxID=412755 RepID=A0A0F9GR09_9ZZZZ